MAKEIRRQIRRFTQLSEEAQAGGQWVLAEHYRHLAHAAKSQAQFAGRN